MKTSITGLESKPGTSGTVLVTGGSGFVGQHLVSALVARSRRVRILDIRPPRSAPPKVQYAAGSACDPRVVDEALYGVDEIYHLAAMPGMWTPKKKDFDVSNRFSTETMLTAARKHGVARFLHCSTEFILFGRERSAGVITEEMQTSANEMAGVYTRSKKAAEELALQAAVEGVPVVIANPTMPIGPHDYELTPPTAMIWHFVCRRIQVHINAVMNIVDVRDVAAGLILVMERGRSASAIFSAAKTRRYDVFSRLSPELPGALTCASAFPRHLHRRWRRSWNLSLIMRVSSRRQRQWKEWKSRGA